LLDVFKREKNFLTRAKEVSHFRYLIDFDEQGAYLEVVDIKNTPLINLDYRVYNGIDREIIEIINEENQKNFFNINWDDSSKKLYLNKNKKLLEILRSSDKLYFKDKNLSFDSGVYFIDLKIIPKNDKLNIILSVDGIDDFEFITSDYILYQDKIRQIHNIGEHFNKLLSFRTDINSDKLEEFLTILFTNFENIHINYNGYKTIYENNKKTILPAVIFESVSDENELILRTSATIGKLSPEFFNQFNISKIVLLNELEKRISVYECDFSDVFEIYSIIYSTLNKLKRSLKSGTFSEEDGFFVIDENIATNFILNNIHTLLDRCELFGSEKLKSYKYNTSTPILNVSFKDKIDFLDTGDVYVSLGDEQFDIFKMIDLYKKHSYIPLSNGEKALIDKGYIAKLQRIFKKDKGKVKVSFFDLPEIEEIITQKEQKVFKDSKKFYDGFNKIATSKTKLPTFENITLRDYQKEGIRWLKYLYDNNFGGCLADDMGLGKTLQIIGLLSYIYSENNKKSVKPSLIVMPKSLLNNWQNELKKFNPNLSFYIYYANERDIKEIKNYQVILSSYAIVRNDIEKLKEVEFDTVVLDESQNIKNVESKISKAVMLLNSKHKFALSGTPIENSLFELYSLFRFINGGIFGTVNQFKNDFVVPIQSHSNENVAKALKAKITPFLLRRLKSNVLKELPAKQEQVIYVDMDTAHKRFYEEKKNYYKMVLDQQIAQNGIEKSRFVILQAFNELRQIASAPQLKTDEQINSSKIENLFELLEDIIANDHKVLIFANFLGSLDIISNKANDIGIEHLIMTGSTKNRQELVDKFQKDDTYKMMLMTLKVGGVGLNLTSADYVFIFDPWWNRAAENQAIDRAHRMGQKNTVFSYKMITKDTIEEKILELQSQKQDMTDMIISGEDGGLKQLTSADLDYILG